MFPFSVDDYPELKKALDDLEEVLKEVDRLRPKKVIVPGIEPVQIVTVNMNDRYDDIDLVKLFQDSGFVVESVENGNYSAMITIKPKDEPDATDH